jgi:hypothetical protein
MTFQKNIEDVLTILLLLIIRAKSEEKEDKGHRIRIRPNSNGSSPGQRIVAIAPSRRDIIAAFSPGEGTFKVSLKSYEHAFQNVIGDKVRNQSFGEDSFPSWTISKVETRVSSLQERHFGMVGLPFSRHSFAAHNLWSI